MKQMLADLSITGIIREEKPAGTVEAAFYCLPKDDRVFLLRRHGFDIVNHVVYEDGTIKSGSDFVGCPRASRPMICILDPAKLNITDLRWVT